MSNIVRTNGGAKSQALAPADPVQRAMREMLRWDPFREMAPSGFASEQAAFSPAFEVKETKDAFVFKADLPGMKEKDIEVKLHGNRLTISGSREAELEDKSDAYYTYERSYGSFTRAFTLPEGIDADHVQADLKEGVLAIAVPKKAGAHAKTIAIKTGGKS